MNDFSFDKTSRWPNPVDIEDVVRSFAGKQLHLIEMKAIGSRSLILKFRDLSKSIDFVAYTQRSNDKRQNLSLNEEAELLRYVAKHLPNQSINLLYSAEPDNVKVPFLVVEKKDGVVLRDYYYENNSVDSFYNTLKDELKKIHYIGLNHTPPDISRTISLHRLLSRAQRWDSSKSGIKERTWLDCLEQTVSVINVNNMETTLLHGDPHAYNLLYSNDSFTWLDFEYSSIGPPQIDLARMLLLLNLQIGDAFFSEGQISKIQLVCNIFIFEEFLNNPPALTSNDNLKKVRQLLILSINLLK